MHNFVALAFPELRDLPADARWRALLAASSPPFDAVELVGAALCLVLVAWLSGEGASMLATSGLPSGIVVTAALVALVLASLWLRHARRGLRNVQVGNPPGEHRR
jgi:hypothetical protein